ERAPEGTKYSLRAANAAACVANYEPDQYWNLNTILFENQPEETGPTPDDKQLKKWVEQAGVTDTTDVDACIDSGRFEGWAQSALERWRDNPIPNSDYGSGPNE